MFNIAFSAEVAEDSSVRHGQIQIGAFSEWFESELGLWNATAYESQWIEGVRRVVERRENSCLITSLTNPESANFITWWPIYVLDNRALFKNQLLFLDRLHEPFDILHPHKSLDVLSLTTKDGDPVSHWQIPVGNLANWLATRVPGQQGRLGVTS